MGLGGEEEISWHEDGYEERYEKKGETKNAAVRVNEKRCEVE